MKISYILNSMLTKFRKIICLRTKGNNSSKSNSIKSTKTTEGNKSCLEVEQASNRTSCQTFFLKMPRKKMMYIYNDIKYIEIK
jgi:hypothetical protein